MKKLSGTWARVLGTMLLAAVLFPETAHAAMDAFIWFDGVKGDSTDSGHKGWFAVTSYQWDDVLARAQAEKMGPPVKQQVLVITKEWGAASPQLKAFCANGKHFSELNVDVVSGGKTLHYHLMDVTVISFRTTGGGDKPTEEISLNFQKVTVN
jgi:type VI secretion system secreted protein Hcp